MQCSQNHEPASVLLYSDNQTGQDFDYLLYLQNGGLCSCRPTRAHLLSGFRFNITANGTHFCQVSLVGFVVCCAPLQRFSHMLADGAVLADQRDMHWSGVDAGVRYSPRYVRGSQFRMCHWLMGALPDAPNAFGWVSVRVVWRQHGRVHPVHAGRRSTAVCQPGRHPRRHLHGICLLHACLLDLT